MIFLISMIGVRWLVPSLILDLLHSSFLSLHMALLYLLRKRLWEAYIVIDRIQIVNAGWTQSIPYAICLSCLCVLFVK